MIRVIREDGVEILLNSDLIQRVEENRARKAIVFMSTGDQIKLKTPVADVIQKTKAYQQGIKQERRDYEKNLEKLEKEKIEQEKEKEKLELEKQEKALAKLKAAEEAKKEDLEEKNWNIADVTPAETEPSELEEHPQETEEEIEEDVEEDTTEEEEDDDDDDPDYQD